MLSFYRWEPTYLWVSLDVMSLYTLIPHDVGLMAVEHFLSADPLINPRQAHFILEATQFCLKHNYFEFEDSYYLQTQGTAMGANFAPIYANLTMGYWERQYISHNNPFIANIILFGRYINDIVIIWDGTIDSLVQFVSHCNHNNLGLSFTHVVNPDRLAFLDLELYHSDSCKDVTNYLKPTAGNSFIPYQSCHHPRWISDIPRSHFHRIRRNSTKDEDYQTRGQLLTHKFLDKGYPSTLVEDAFQQYTSKPLPKPIISDEPQPIQFTTQFHDCYKKLNTI